jgi:hypothetical protein
VSSRGTTPQPSLAASPKPARDDAGGFATTPRASSRPISRTPRTNDAYEFPRKDGGFGFGRSRRNVSPRFNVSERVLRSPTDDPRDDDVTEPSRERLENDRFDSPPTPESRLRLTPSREFREKKS